MMFELELIKKFKSLSLVWLYLIR